MLLDLCNLLIFFSWLSFPLTDEVEDHTLVPFGSVVSGVESPHNHIMPLWELVSTKS